MSLLTTSAASIHQLFSAAAFAGSTRWPGGDSVPVDDHGTDTIESFWTFRDVLSNALLTSGWVIEQRTIRKQHIDKETNGAVSTKDICVAGAMITNIANAVVNQMMKREFSEGLQVRGDGTPADGTPAAAVKYLQYFKVAKGLNRAFVAGAIGFTPSVNFNVLKSYRPATLFRLFT